MLSQFFPRRQPQSLPLFAIGSLQLSEKVHWLASKGLIDPLPYVQRHLRGDWGDIDEASRQANDAALRQDEPVRSIYRITPQLELIVITAEDHASTIIQLPEEKPLT
ncbi:FIG146805: Plasmid related protein [plant metagenome]|uniref:FIG146805: Plasmid related protein n=1 Tax=plant metagenome TaxID=1297885 RepID=A0A484SIJ8_9ZZZZ